MNAIDPRAAALAEIQRWAQHQANARPRLIADAWRAGCRNVAELARAAGCSRDTVYADLTAQGIDYSDRATKETPMPTPAPSAATTVTWHHPHFVSAKETHFGIKYQFKAFTGDEPEPTLPESASLAFRNACDAFEVGSAERRAVSDAWTAAEREARAAHTSWRVARYHRDVAAVLRKAAPAAEAYLRAKQAADAAYAALDDAPDGKWRATLLRLADARTAALAAAEQFDQAVEPAAGLIDGLPERTLELIDSIDGVGRQIGLDTSDWWIGSSDEYHGYGAGPSRRKLSRQFKEQDQRIKEVSRLAGDSQ
ncbi:hypothetical protein ABZ671_18840 [Micromonospora sp. NPDC006766]|uniref:hypothetical protein n=1 Tax=Micromonospora sp. NPDC006766 TaxID=3154778 RepID=UPI0033E01757